MSDDLSTSDNFVHLHTHTEYSMLDGAAKLDDLFSEVARLGMPAIATTDHGFLFGAYDFWKTAQKYGVKPIIGVEAYLSPGTHRSDKTRVKWGTSSTRSGDDVSGAGSYTHMTLLSENNKGMHNLFKLSSRASLEGFLYKPRADRELLSEYSEGLIGTTGCPSGEVQTRLRLGQYKEAVQAAADFRDIFGAGNFYAELMDHGLEIEKRIQADLIKLARELGLPLLATNDLHYTKASDARAHEALLAVQSGATLTDPKRFKFDADEFYVKTAGQMRELWKEFPEACDNTLLVAERCEVTFEEEVGKYMPKFPCPEGESEASWFIKEVNEGLIRRYPAGVPGNARKQADYEIDVIVSKNYAGYFLVVADYIGWSKKNGIRVGPGRGSGAGSLAAYALGITELDPIVHNLVFERFINPQRDSLPDFDCDFDDSKRHLVLAYVTEKYGDDRVAQIVTYGTIKAKQSVKDAARVLGYPFSVGDRATKAMPAAVMGKDVPVNEIFNPDHKRYGEGAEFRELYNSDDEVRKAVDLAKGLEGLKRQWGVHAAGVIMSSEPITDVIPIMKRESDGAIITNFSYEFCENLGLVKMDFLGLRNLTIIDEALANIERNVGKTIVLEELTLDDPETFALLGRGDTLGVFQFDGGPMRSLLRLMRPTNFEDISAVGALYRPGPMGAGSHTAYARRKNNEEPSTYPHPELAEPLEEILGTTFGLIVYQEQVMSIAQKLAGYTLGDADLLRRAMGKKKKEVLDREFVPFRDGMLKNGYSKDSIKTLWDILVPFSDYAFNKAHSAAYGLISYWTAYLKAHYPAEYMAAVLTSVRDDKDKAAIYLHECRSMGITVLSPDVNESQHNFTAVGGDIRFGLGGVKDVGPNVVNTVVNERANGPYTSFEDFVKRAVGANKKSHEALIKSGAFDTLSPSRLGLTLIMDEAVRAATDTRRAEAKGQFDLFSSFGIDVVAPIIVPTDEWDKKARLAFERAMLGLYVSGHPLDDVDLSHENPTPIAFLAGDEFPDGSEVKVAGLLTNVEHKISKAGKPWGKAMVEDKDGSIEVCFFSRTYEAYRDSLVNDEVVVVAGKVDKGRDNGVVLLASGLRAPSKAAARQPMVEDFSIMVVVLDSEALTGDTVAGIKRVLGANAGDIPVEIELPSGKRFPSSARCSGSLSSRLQMREVPCVKEIIFV